MANRRWTIGISAVLLVGSLTLVGLYQFARGADSERQIRLLIDKTYSVQRPGGGRLSGAAYNPPSGSPNMERDLGRAQILLLSQPDSAARRQLQGLIYLAGGDWQKFVETAKHLPPKSWDSSTLNNLGASLLALSDKDPSLLLDALDAFERASALDPEAHEPLFNLVTTYRRLRFPKLAYETLQRYNALDPGSGWNREIANPTQADEASSLDALKRAVESNNLIEAERLFKADSDLCRRAAMQYGLSKAQDSPALVQFIAQQMEHHYQDKTISAMLAPLFNDQREKAIALREFVTQGAELYLRGNYPESLETYTEAGKVADTMDSPFDRLWIDLNKVDTEIRLGQFGSARRSLSHIVSASREQGFAWLAARALSIYGYSVRLTDSYGEMLGLLSEADRTLADLGAVHDRVRALYYLSAYQNGAGDKTEALKLALECLRLTSEGDATRIATLDWLIGSILYRRGMSKRALLFEQESVEQSQKEPNANLITTTAATLAQLYESTSEHRSAEQYLQVARDAVQGMPAGFDQARNEMLLGIVGARIELDQKRYSEAESLLEKNLDLYSRQPFPATDLRFPSLMLLARTYSETGRLRKAAQKFNEAIDLVENDDQYLVSEKLRVMFDDERRELYDSAIEFEYNHGSPDAAWMYLQKYRAKLFLEFLAQFNPSVRQTRARLDRSRVQQQIPGDVQIIEYVLLKDRLLTWVVTDRIFTVRSVSVNRTSLEEKVQEALQKLRAGNDVEQPLADLEKLLIEPIADLLDPNRTMVIIPDRALHGLPFAALRRPASGEYLIQAFPMIVSPSLTYLLATKAVQPRRDGIIGFGSQNGDSSEAKELGALANIYPKSQMFGGRMVDKDSFLTAMRNAAVFHYAGHSATDAVDPLRSSILLDGNRFGPNSVTAVDIAQQRLANNAIVVLSSCDSAVGNSRDGIGMRGLTSAFLIGGAGSVVGSLWPVEASSTADLMIRFHRAFANSQMPVAKALREAQLRFLQSFPDRSHPYYWSGFVVTGNFTALR